MPDIFKRVWYPDKNGHIYESIYDGQNSWSPDEYPQGWEKVS